MLSVPFRWAYSLVAAGFAGLYTYTAFRGPFDLFLHRSLFLLFALALIILRYPLRRKWGRAVDLALVALVVLSVGNVVVNHTRIAYQAGIPTTFQVYMGVLALLLVFEASRRTIGPVLPILALASIAYAYFGQHIPGIWGNPGYTFQDIVGFLYLTPDGLWGIPLGVAATIIIAFIVLGAFLLRVGLADFLNHLATRLAGRLTGGPAQVAVWGSAAFGTVSGAAPANVAVTGSVTIPMMKRMGFSAGLAGAVESAASAGGQIMPPIMGAAVFIMIELLDLPYSQVIKAAAIPAILYFLGVSASVLFSSARLGLKGLSREEIDARCPPYRDLLRRSYLLLPMVLLVFLVFRNYPITRSAFYALAATVVVGLVASRGRFGPREIWRSLVDGAEKVLPVSMGIACSAIIYAIIVMTGLGVKFSTLVVQAVGENAFLLLVMSAVATLILGSALTTTASYLIAAATIAPALTAVGIPPLSAHLFIFYYAVLATVTPPQGMALYTAAGLAGAHWADVGLKGLRLTISGFLVPFAFVYMPGLLLEGPVTGMLAHLGSVVLGVVALSAGLSGYLFAPMRMFLRAPLVLAAGLLFYPNGLASLAGAALVVVLALAQWRLRARLAVSARGEAEVVR